MKLIDVQEPVIDCRAPISWTQLAALLQHRLDRARSANDVVGKPVAETEAIRGEIRCLKDLLDLPNLAAQRQPTLPSELS